MINLFRDYAGLYAAAFDWDDSDQVVSIIELTGLEQKMLSYNVNVCTGNN